MQQTGDMSAKENADELADEWNAEKVEWRRVHNPSGFKKATVSGMQREHAADRLSS
jgi:hypothetical protein